MTTSDPRHYDVIIAPVITEKATLASERSQGHAAGAVSAARISAQRWMASAFSSESWWKIAITLFDAASTTTDFVTLLWLVGMIDSRYCSRPLTKSPYRLPSN